MFVLTAGLTLTGAVATPPSQVLAWGGDGGGQLGDGTPNAVGGRATPTPVTGLPVDVNVTALAAGTAHSLALLADGTVMAWGENSYGQLGFTTGTNLYSATPGKVMKGDGSALDPFAPLDHIVAVAAGGEFSLALQVAADQSTTVWAWGAGAAGQTGDPTFARNTTPHKVPGLPGTVLAIAAGATHALAVLADPVGAPDPGPALDQTLDAVASADPGALPEPGTVVDPSAAPPENGRVWGWGSGANLELGLNNPGGPVPLPVMQKVEDANFNSPPEFVDRTISVAAGIQTSFAVITDGTALSWGNNAYGALGQGSSTNGNFSPHHVVQLDPGGFLGIESDAKVKSVSAAASHAMARMGDGSVRAWGRNSSGQVGNGDTTNQNRAVKVAGLNGMAVTAVAAGGEHSLALSDDGKVLAWGRSLDGQLGVDPSTCPEPTMCVVPQQAGLAAATAIAAGAEHGLAIAPPSVPITHTLTVARAGSGSGRVTSDPPGGIDCGSDCTEAYSDGTVVTLTATATDAGSVFSGWSGACSGTGTCTLAMDADRSATASFTTIATTTTQPPVTTTTTQPPDTTTTTQPPVTTTTQPPVTTTTQPPVTTTTTQPPDTTTTTQPPDTTTTTQPPDTTTTTQPPDATATTQPRDATTTTQPPDATATTQPRDATVAKPASTSSGPASSGHGYWLVASDGGIFAFGDARFAGSTGAIALNKPIVAMAPTPSGHGYWLVASDGGIFAFGDARFAGSTGAIRLAQPIVAMAPTPSGNGYWLVASDGGIFAFGDAGFFGSAGAIKLNQPIVGMAATPAGKGYWLVGSDGSIFAFGDAVSLGSAGAMRLAKPIVAMAATSTGKGYWLVASDGGIFAFGDAGFAGSTGAIKLNRPIVGMDASSTGKGYRLVASDGGIFAFGDATFAGSTGAIHLNRPVVGIAGR